MTPGFPDRATIERGQLQALRTLVGEVLDGNGFYRRKWAGTGLSPALETLDEFQASVPFTWKQELVEDQLSHPPYGTNLTYPVERYTRLCQTSGTTGTPMRWLDTTEGWSWMVDNWAEVLRVSGVTRDDRIFFAFSFGPFLGFWTAYEAGIRLGCLCIPGGGMSSAARLRTLLDNGATVLCCTPTYAMHLGEVAQEQGIDLRQGSVRTIVVAGEPGAAIPGTRARIERLWGGARLWDHHGMTEVGPVTFECPVRTGVLHVLEGGYIPEVVDPATGTRLPRGSRGELVLTNLGRPGSPLVRYRTGDLVQGAVDERCTCGRYDMALEGGILGRTDDMVLVRGVNLYPNAFETLLRNFDQVAEYRVEIDTTAALTQVEVQVEPVPECPDAGALQAAVETALRSAFSLRIPVETVSPGTLPRFELKAKRWVRRQTVGARKTGA